MFWKCQKGFEGARTYAKLGQWDSVEQMMADYGLTDKDIEENYWLIDEKVDLPEKTNLYGVPEDVLIASICGRRFWSLKFEMLRIGNSIFVPEDRFDEVFN